jgi:hypothetical protein
MSIHDQLLAGEGSRLAARASQATAGAPNETSLMHELEKELERSCSALDIPWTPFRLDVTLHGAGFTRFADVAHGAVVIEYEPPRTFGGRLGARLEHARAQACEYGELLAAMEGRDRQEYVLVAWDGAHIDFGRLVDAHARWQGPVPFTASTAERLLRHLASDGVPLVHPQLIAQLAGPSSSVGAELVPRLFDAIVAAQGERPAITKTSLLFTEWRRLFGQVSGVQSDRLREFLEEQGEAHARAYREHPGAYLFALYTFLALVAKLIAAMSLPGATERLTDEAAPIAGRIRTLETGDLFAGAGIVNMLNGDFFSWYRDDECWTNIEPLVGRLIRSLSGVDFRVTRKSPDSTRDLFKGLYQTFVPGPLRHALGEFYTPDWLAEHALDLVSWSPQDDLLDPACGSGTFLLEGMRRRLLEPGSEEATAGQLLSGLHGLDLNPLAVLAARASLVVYLADRFDPRAPVRLPVFLADAVHPVAEEAEIFRHQFQSEPGVIEFTVPGRLVRDERFFAIFDRIRGLVDADLGVQSILEALRGDLPVLDEVEQAALSNTINALVSLHDQEWNGIWCAILADRFAAGAISPATHVIGNPPWVKWSNLPPEYAAFIKDDCVALGAFSTDSWVGGIESDISTVITLEALRSRLRHDGILAFFITGTVFANESSQGFRRFEIPCSGIRAKVLCVEDYDDVAPFEGVANHPTLLILKRGESTTYPVPYRRWSAPRVGGRVTRAYGSGAQFRANASCSVVLAEPVPGTDAGPWLKGTAAQHEVWRRVFSADEPKFRARKGVTTDLNGVFFVDILGVDGPTSVRIRNEPLRGRGANRNIPRVSVAVEPTHLFPLMRGRGLRPFNASVDAGYVLVPQRGKDGDPDLPVNAPLTYAYLRRFEERLRNRGSYRRYQAGKPFWSLWSTGPYSFADHKVVWQEMPGGRFGAAYLTPVEDEHLGRKTVICDHKLYFVPCRSEDEAAFLTGFLNAPLISSAVGAYAAQLSLGASVVEYLNIPSFEPSNETQSSIVRIARGATTDPMSLDQATYAALNELAVTLLGIPDELLDVGLEPEICSGEPVA